MSNCLKIVCKYSFAQKTTGFNVINKDSRFRIQKFQKGIGIQYKINGYMQIPYIILYYIRANMKAQKALYHALY